MAQLVDRGLSGDAVNKRVVAGRLHRIHSGVFAVGNPLLSKEGRAMAAVLACGPDAVLSHRSAASLWGIYENRRPSIDVAAPNRRGRAPRGIDSHRDGHLPPIDRRVHRGVPCTSVPRTLLDLAAVVSARELRQAVGEAEVLRLLNHASARALIHRNRGRRGVDRLRRVLDEIHPQIKRTRSEMERRFLEMCSRFELPEPEVNVILEVGDHRLRPDFLWRPARLIVEADSRRFHGTDTAFLRDRKREQRLQVAGWRVSHCAWEQVEHEPRALSQTIRSLLS